MAWAGAYHVHARVWHSSTPRGSIPRPSGFESGALTTRPRRPTPAGPPYGATIYRPTIRTGYVGLNVLDMEITNMFQSKKLSTRTRPRKVPTATTYFPVEATLGGWDLANLRPDLGSYHDSKTFGLFRLPRSHQNFRVLKCTMAQAPSTVHTIGL